jgi:Family of unknown function (DUF6714)
MPLPPSHADHITALIERAFADTPSPDDQDLVRSQGEEPETVKDLFRGRKDWRLLEPALIDRAGAASPSALSFFSAAAFRFYLPAYLVADLRGQLQYTDPVFYLYHGLDEASRNQPVPVPGRGTQTWWEVQQSHLAGFTAPEAAAIVAYLRFKADFGTLVPAERQSVTEALANYWLGRSGARAL